MNPSNNWSSTPMGAPEGSTVSADSVQLPAAMPAVQQVMPQQTAPETSPVQIDIDENKETSLDAAWVSRAKDVAIRYSSDPYEQSKQMSSLKSQFIKARYNKDVREADD